MDVFLEYISEIKNVLSNIQPFMKVHIVMGNESCDLDSMISALALAYYLQRKVYDQKEVIVVPLLNINSEELAWRTENCHVLKQSQLNEENLIFRNDINLNHMQTQNSLSLTLVDHHILKPEDQFLESSVRQIFDHRPKDPSSKWDLDTVRFVLKEVGSCATLIAEEIIRTDPTILCLSLAMLLYNAITFDTLAYNLEAGKVKELDLWVANYLEEHFKLPKLKKHLFDELWHAHNNVSHLTPKQLLLKDLKVVENIILIPGLPMLVQTFFKLQNAISELVKFNEQKKSRVVVLMGLQVVEIKEKKEVRRDIAIFPNDDPLGKLIVKCLKKSNESSGGSLELKEISVNVSKVTCMKQENIKITRKQIIPIIKLALSLFQRGE